MSDPGDYYDRKAAEVKEIRLKISYALAHGASREEIERLEKQLAAAEHLGD